MADEIETKVEEAPEPVEVEKPETEEKPEATENLEKDNENLLKAELEAQRERAEAAEALIIKNKAMAKRHKDDDPEEIPEEERPITRKELEEALSNFKPKSEESDEAKRLAEANRRIKEIEAQKAEIARALKSKEQVTTAEPGTHRDPTPGAMPKISAIDAKGLKDSGYTWDGIKRLWKKPLSGGKYLYTRNLQDKEWIE